jgi:hypothetical protein
MMTGFNGCHILGMHPAKTRNWIYNGNPFHYRREFTTDISVPSNTSESTWSITHGVVSGAGTKGISMPPVTPGTLKTIVMPIQ